MTEARGRSNRDRIRALEAALDDLVVAFQPIRDLWTGETIGYDALPVFADRTPQTWFTEAHWIGRALDFEIEAISRALDARDDRCGFLAVDVSPAVVASPTFVAFIRDLAEPRRLVLELTEYTAVSDDEGLADAVAALRAAGVRIAIDDAGGGLSSFRFAVTLHPEIIKVDRSLFCGVDEQLERHALADRMVQFAERIGAELIAEGVERPEERDACRRYGIRYGQGRLLGAPCCHRPG